MAKRVEGKLHSQTQNSEASGGRPWPPGIPLQEKESQLGSQSKGKRCPSLEGGVGGVPDLIKAGTYLLEMKHKLVDLILLIEIKLQLLFRTGSEEYRKERRRSGISLRKGGSWSFSVEVRRKAQDCSSVRSMLGSLRSNHTARREARQQWSLNPKGEGQLKKHGNNDQCPMLHEGQGI